MLFQVRHFARSCLPVQMGSQVLAGPMGRAGPQAVGKSEVEKSYLCTQGPLGKGASLGSSPLKGFLYGVAGEYLLELSLCIRIS